MAHATDNQTRHACGGTVLLGGSGEQAHIYCDQCGAFTYDTDGALPSGTDPEANRAAWDDGDSESPEAVPSVLAEAEAHWGGPVAASRHLGIAYSTWAGYKSGARPVPEYIRRSIIAHLELDRLRATST